MVQALFDNWADTSDVGVIEAEKRQALRSRHDTGKQRKSSKPPGERRKEGRRAKPNQKKMSDMWKQRGEKPLTKGEANQMQTWGLSTR